MFSKICEKLMIVLAVALFIQSVVFSLEMKAMHLNKNQLYVLDFDDEIEFLNNDNKVLDAQIMNTIFDDKKRLILKLKEDKPTVLQVKTKNHYYNYEVGFVRTDDTIENLTVIDVPPANDGDLIIDLPPALGEK
ncbi:MAG: hypothetical protein PHX18_07045 [Candidatus Gastranaerophilales bacterium]|nr:hypothetical protein [Candidatus Gastranaerophilales bacterium]